MKPSEIKAGVGEVPISPLGFIPGDRYIWEHTDSGAHFKVTRHILYEAPRHPEVISLSVSGLDDERERVIAEFSEVLGAPAMRDVVPGTLEHIDTVLWLTPKPNE